MPNEEKKMSDWEEEMFDKLGDIYYDSSPAQMLEKKKRIKSFIASVRSEAYEEGRKSVLDEMKHDQEKLTDGFSHNCDKCK